MVEIEHEHFYKILIPSLLSSCASHISLTHVINATTIRLSKWILLRTRRFKLFSGMSSGYIRPGGQMLCMSKWQIPECHWPGLLHWYVYGCLMICSRHARLWSVVLTSVSTDTLFPHHHNVNTIILYYVIILSNILWISGDFVSLSR